jgi:hypothetical protein
MLASLNQFGPIIFEKWSSLPGDHLLGTPATEAVNNAGVALSRLTSTLSTIALIKANVCRILEPPLLIEGFNVLNRGNCAPSTSLVTESEQNSEFSLWKS